MTLTLRLPYAFKRKFPYKLFSIVVLFQKSVRYNEYMLKKTINQDAQKIVLISGNRVLFSASARGLTAVRFLDNGEHPGEVQGDKAQNSVINSAARQLEEYYAGTRRSFDVPIDWTCQTPFRKRVLQAAYSIPFGKAITYQQLAEAAGNYRAARAVGGALAHHPWGIIVPCHRVVSADGSLHGFSAPGGLQAKARLLRHEGLQVEFDKVKI